MVKTTKERDHHAAERQQPAAGEVTVTNMYRNQPIAFHYLGGSVRLGPLETRHVSRGCLASPELMHLMSIGAVSVHEAAAGDSEAGREGRPQTAATPKEH